MPATATKAGMFALLGSVLRAVQDGRPCPSVSQMAAEMGVHRRSASARLRGAIQAGHCQRERDGVQSRMVLLPDGGATAWGRRPKAASVRGMR